MRVPVAVFIVVLGLNCPHVHAAPGTREVTAGVARTAPKQVVINGRPAKMKILDVDAKHFVAIEDLAQALRGTVTYGDDNINLTFAELSQGSAQSAGTAGGKRTLSYSVNDNLGNKPDTGSVWLLKTIIAILNQ
jgi:hypothetical protein